MQYRRRAVDLARTVYHRLPPRAQQGAARVVGRVLDHYRTTGPLLSVIMPVYNVETYLDEAVDSVLSQSYRNIELILVDDGSKDSSGAMCDTIAQRDNRVRVIHKRNGGLGAARNTGIDAAKGSYLVFCDSDDVVPENAYRAMMSSVRRSGSQVVTGNVRRMAGSRLYQAWNQERSHTMLQRSVTLRDVPDLVYDTVAWNKVYEAAFFRRYVKGFPVGKLYEDMLPVFTAFANATSIDILPSPVYHWRVRDEGDSITQRLHEVKNISDRMEMAIAIDDMIDDHGLRDVLGDRFRLKVLEGDLWIYVRVQEKFEQDMVEPIRVATERFWSPANDSVRAQLPPERRVTYWLSEQGRGSEAVLFRSWYESVQLDPPVIRDGANLRLDVTDSPVSLVGMDDSLVDMQIAAEGWASVAEVAWTGPVELTVGGYAYTRFVSDGQQTITVLATQRGSGRTVELPAERGPQVHSALGAKDTASDHLHDGFRCRIDVQAFAEQHHRGRGAWELSVRIADGAIERVVPLDRIWRSGSAATVGAATLADGSLVLAETERGKPVTLAFSSAGLRASRLELDGTRLVVAFPAEPAVSSVHLEMSSGHKVIIADRAPDGAFVAQVPLAPVTPSITWRVMARTGGRKEAVLPPLGFGWDATPATSGVRAETSRTGTLVVQSHRNTAMIDSLEVLESGDIALSGSLLGLSSVEIGLAVPTGEPQDWRRAEVSEGHFSVTVSTSEADYAGVTRPLRTGRYQLFARRPGQPMLAADGEADAEVRMSDQLTAAMPQRHLRESIKVEFSRLQRGRVRVDLYGPVPDELLGRYEQERLAVAAADPDRELEEAVLFYVDIGGNAADSALAIHDELRRRNCALTLYWGIEDLSIPVPEGGVAVVKNSVEWYRVMHASRYIVNNYGGLYGLTKHPDQQYLQTWHGTPLKFIGVSEARIKNALNIRLDQIAGEAADWDAFVSPSPYVSAMLPTEWLYNGRVLETGYPRNDRLAVADDAERRRLRALLGLPDDAKVLLYAPTYRERQRRGWRAEMFDALDLDELLNLLGPSWWVLLRGHSFNARNDYADRAGQRLVDATSHRDVNDLYLAADALVTDYSSVMFDFCVTGRPMAFFTPDLKQYVASRGTYFDLEAVAPGPMCDDVQTLARGLGDLDGLARSYADKYAAFRDKFAPWDDGHAAARVVDEFF